MAIRNLSYPRFKYTDTSGNPVAGGKLFVYDAGTTTKKTTYTDSTKGAANTNPIILDSNGEADVWFEGSAKFVLAPSTDTDPPTSPIWTVDNVQAVPDATVTGNFNLVQNGSFEIDVDADNVPDGWTLTPDAGGTIVLDNTDAIHGGNSLKFTSTGTGGGVAETTSFFEVFGGLVHVVNFGIKSSSVSTRNKVIVDWYDISQVLISSSTAYDDGATNPVAWTQKSPTVTAPATATYAKLRLIGVDPASTTHGVTAFDDVLIAPSVMVTNSHTLQGFQPSTTSAANRIPVANGSGKIDSAYITFPTNVTGALVTNTATAAITAGKTITGITQANPASVTVASHGYNTGDIVYITAVGGMVEVKDRFYTITNTGANTFTLDGIDSTGYTAYTSGGVASVETIVSWTSENYDDSAYITVPATSFTLPADARVKLSTQCYTEGGLGAPFCIKKNGTITYTGFASQAQDQLVITSAPVSTPYIDALLGDTFEVSVFASTTAADVLLPESWFSIEGV